MNELSDVQIHVESLPQPQNGLSASVFSTIDFWSKVQKCITEPVMVAYIAALEHLVRTEIAFVLFCNRGNFVVRDIHSQ